MRYRLFIYTAMDAVVRELPLSPIIGMPHLPRKKDRVIFDGTHYVVTEVMWDFDTMIVTVSIATEPAVKKVV